MPLAQRLDATAIWAGRAILPPAIGAENPRLAYRALKDGKIFWVQVSLTTVLVVGIGLGFAVRCLNRTRRRIGESVDPMRAVADGARHQQVWCNVCAGSQRFSRTFRRWLIVRPSRFAWPNEAHVTDAMQQAGT